MKKRTENLANKILGELGELKEMVSDNLIFESVSFAKSMGIDIVKVLKEKISIEEISL